ncbi:MAG: cytochrome c, partial [Chloroflexi bacterium]|nr:cytochrome c [Chloroflexota bacterium]
MHLPHQRWIVFGFVAFLAFAIACTTDESNPIPTSVPAATSTPVPDDYHADDEHEDDDHADDEGHEADIDAVALGREVYGTVGCAACHGVDAEGSDIGPALSGHNELQVRRQVRAPIGIMTVFDQEILPPADLDALVAYIESLVVGGDHAHAHDAEISVADQSLAHHRMTLTAFEADNFEEAEHHIEHLTTVLDGQHLALMQEALSATQAGAFHDAQHMVEGMLADVLAGEEGIDTLHYQLAIAGLRVGESEEAAHHLEHAVAELADPIAIEETEEILAFIALGDVGEAEEHLSSLMGIESTGVDDAHIEEGDEHATDEHDAEATHEEGDEHATDEHDAEATHEEGDEHATDEHDAEAT